MRLAQIQNPAAYNMIRIGYVSKPAGLKGEILVRPLHEEFEWPPLKRLKQVVIGQKAQKAQKAFPVRALKAHKKGVRFSLEGVCSREQAERLRGLEVFIEKKRFPDLKQEFYLFEIKGFEVFLEEKGAMRKLGKIRSFAAAKGQDLLLVQEQAETRDILIPFAATYIQELSFQEKRLILRLPQGFPL